MANWGKPDDKTVVTLEQQEAIWARVAAETKGEGLTQWPFEGPAGFHASLVKRHCVDTTHPEVAAWQKVRLSMKGVPTHKKLGILKDWWDKHIATYNLADGVMPVKKTGWGYSVYIQVYNYLGALRRGGQLDDQNRIRKYI